MGRSKRLNRLFEMFSTLSTQHAVVPRLDKLREEMIGVINAGHERVQAIGGIYCEAYS